MTASASLLFLHCPSRLRIPHAYFTTCLRLRLAHQPSGGSDLPPVSLLHLSVLRQYWILNQLSIIYAFRPRLRSRLTPGGRTFPGKPQTSDGGVSRSPLATYAGILSCLPSTAPSGTASASRHCSSTDAHSCIPKLRCQVLAPIIIRASSLDQ